MKAIRTWRRPSGTYVAIDGDGNRAVIPAPEQYATAHRDAAVALIRKMGWAPVVIASGWSKGGESVHVMLPRMPEPARLALASVSKGELYPVEPL